MIPLAFISQTIDFHEPIMCEVRCSEIVTKPRLLFSLPTLVTKVTSEFQPFPDFGLHVVSGDVLKRSERVLEYLSAQELANRLPWERDDIRVAWITVLKASEGHPAPFTQAFWQYFGETPEKLIPFFAARLYVDSDPFWPESMLPFRYTADWPSDFLRGKQISEAARSVLPPKKSSHSVRFPANQKEQTR